MINLRTLGGIAIEAPEVEELRHLLGQPKPLALLCYLALTHRHRFLRRDSLVALFWPTLDHEHGRAALRQTLRVLRQFIGAEAVVNRGDEEIGLDSSRVWCDAISFEELIEAGDLEGAMGLYRGDLLEGLHVFGAGPEFVQWLDEERSRLRRLASEAASRCAEHEMLTGATGPGVRTWVRRAVELDPLDERAFRGLLQFLDHAGDRSGAIREYEQYAARLKLELEALPAAETQALISAIRTRLPPIAPAPSSPEAPPRAEEKHLLGEPPRPRHVHRVLLLGAALAVAASLVALVTRDRTPPPALDPTLVAIMPWRVSGADPGLAYLGEGMLDLLGATLTGERGLRAADPRMVLRAWRGLHSAPDEEIAVKTAAQIAQRIGAGRLIEGAVVGSPDHLTLTAAEFTSSGPRPLVTVSVQGGVDSLPSMIEHLTADLLAREAGDPERVRNLTTTSLPALRLYLEGRAAFRRGLYGEATRDFGEALVLDSNFTLAALSLAAGDLTMEEGDLIAKGKRIAWAESANLSARDRALLEAVVGTHYPSESDEREYLLAREQAVALAPESPEAWYWLGDSYFHHGRLLDLRDWRVRASAGFRRAIELDSAFASPYQHLIEIKLQFGDTVGVRHLSDIYFALDSTGEYGDFLRWRIAVGLADSVALTKLRARFDQMTTESLTRIAGVAQLAGIALDDAERAANSLVAQAASNGRRRAAAYAVEALRSNRGRPAAAVAATSGMSVDPRRPLADKWFRVADAIYTDGDTVAAAQAVREMSRLADGPRRMAPGAADTQDVATCAVALWRLDRHETRGVRQAIPRLRARSPQEPSGLGIWMNACATILEAELAADLGTPDTEAALARLDSLVGAGPALISPLRVASTLVLANLKERTGDLRAALAAVRRRENEYNPRYLSTQLLEEGRLANLLGERPAAIRAYQHYLTLRFDPEPSLKPKVDSIRAVLATLIRRP